MIDTPVRHAPDAISVALRRSRASFDAGDHADGDRAARMALESAVASADEEGQHAAWDLIALHADRRGHMAVAASAAEEALALLPLHAAAARARLHCRLARVFTVLELDAANLRHATAAVACARSCGDSELIAMSLSRLGAARAAGGDWRQAIVLIEEALSLARSERNGVEIYRALNNLTAVSYYLVRDAARRGQVETVEATCRDGLRWADEALCHPATVENPFLPLVARVNRNLLLIHAGRPAEALADSTEALETAQAQGYREVATQLEYVRGKAVVLLGDRARGIALLEAALEHAAADEPSTRARLHEDLYRLHKEDGDFGAALAQHEALLELERSRAARRAEAEFGVLLERAEVQRTRLAAERAQRDAEMERLRAMQMKGELDVMEARAEEMGRHALEDALTGMPNRRRIESAMRTILLDAGGAQGTVSIGIVDIDHFKIVNDTFGHNVGDDVIRAVGMLLTRGLREADLVGRVGGEEFVLLMAHTSLEAASVTAERLRRSIELHDWSSLRPGLAVTVSLGLCMADGPCLSRDAMEMADAALYGAKAAGRNRVVIETAPCG